MCRKFTNSKERRNLFCLGEVREDSIEKRWWSKNLKNNEEFSRKAGAMGHLTERN